MIKSAMKILGIIFLSIAGIFVFFYVISSSAGIDLIEEFQKETKMYESQTNIVISEDGFIEAEKTIQLQLGKKQTELPEITLPIPCIDMRNGEVGIEIDVYVDGELWPEDLVKIDLREDTVLLKNFDTDNKENRIIKLETKYPIDKYIKEYKNYTVLSIKDKVYNRKSIVNISMPRESKEVLLDDWYEMDRSALRKTDDKTYTIDLSLIDSSYSIKFVFDTGVVKNATTVNEHYLVKDILEEQEFVGKDFLFLGLLGIAINFTCLIILFVIHLKNKVKKIYIRDTSEIVEPILAEVIIDRKLSIKNSVMSVLADLICKGNIECIDNQNLVLVRRDGFKSYEKNIVDLVFEKNSKTCSFEKIRGYFIKNNEKAETFYECFSKVKESVLKKLIDEEIFSKRGEIILKSIRVISIIVYVNLIYFAYNLMTSAGFLYINPSSLFMLNVMALLWGIKKENFTGKIADVSKNFYQNIKKDFRMKILIYMWIGFFALMITTLYASIYRHKELFFLYVLVFIINTITYVKAHTHLYTSKGKEIFKKVKGLKAYIDDYSLMKERELESSIIWDDYLTYAIAFGISNKVTDLLGENILKANILLQKIEKTLKF